MKNKKGITLISLIITITLMIIISGVTVSISMDRFKINNVKKMNNDIQLLSDKIETYYLKYGGLPILKENNNNVNYTYSELNFNTDANDNENYYIIDLNATGNFTLNYGKEGYENPNTTDDVYIVNEKTHRVYYVKGIESKNGVIFHALNLDTTNQGESLIGPTKPEINVLMGTEIGTDKEGIKKYKNNVEIEIIPGRDNVNGVLKTEYTIKNIDLLSGNYTTTEKVEISGRKVIGEFETNKKYEIVAKTISNNNIESEKKYTIKIPKLIQFTVNDEIFSAEEGMSWETFCDSEYNTNNIFSIDSNDNEVVMDGVKIIKDERNEIYTDIIINDTNYQKGEAVS